MEEQRNPFRDIGAFFRSGSALSILMMINLAVWLILSVVKVFLFLKGDSPEAFIDNVLNLGAIPANTASLLQRPWTVLTYMFLHIDILHILFNLLWLYWFGRIFLEYLSSGKLTLIYILGGISGGLLYVLFFNVFPVFKPRLDLSFALGASASVMAIVSTVAFYNPGHSIYFILIGRVRIIYIFAILFILDFFLISSENSGGHIAHIGGALLGIVFATAYRKGFNLAEVKDLFRRKHHLKARPGGGRKSYWRGGSSASRPLTDEEYNIAKAERERKLNEILDKISKSGYESLTRAEKEFMFRESKR